MPEQDHSKFLSIAQLKWVLVGLLIAGGVSIGFQGRMFGNGHPPEDMIAIAAQEFEMGTAQGEPDEAPPHRVQVAAFHLDRVEASVAKYAACVAAGKCPVAFTNFLYCNFGKPGRELHPINCVSQRMAEAYCAWRNARLPTEPEWELAARGNDARPYPWGKELPMDRACYLRKRHDLQTCPVGTFVNDKSPFGVMDLAGNVSEWTDTPFCSYADSRECRPGAHVVRGGSWDMENPMFARTTYRDWVDDSKHGYNLGFRCAKDG